MGGVVLIRRANIGDFQNHIAAAVLLPETDAHILLTVSAEIGVLEKIRMDGDLGVEEGVVRDSARGLTGAVHATCIDPHIGVFVGGVELAGREELHVAMVEAVEGEVDVASTILSGHRGGVVFGRFACQLWYPCVVKLGRSSVIGNALSLASEEAWLNSSGMSEHRRGEESC